MKLKHTITPNPLLWAVNLLLLSATVSAFLIPGFGPNIFREGDPVDLHVNKFSSDVTQLPFAYYDNKFVCQPKGGVKHTLLNLGEVFQGDRNMNSDYKIRTKEKITCEVLCQVEIDAETAKTLKGLIKDEYRVEWLLDGLPAATAYTTSEDKKKQYEAGFRLGTFDPATGKAFLHNHVTMIVLYNTQAKDSTAHLIVGFEVYPQSISIPDEKCPDVTLDQQQPPMEIGDEATKITWTYSVFWREEEKVNWANRWDLYLVNSDPQIHWYSIINSLIIMLFLTAMVAIIMLRTLNKDIALYNEEDLKEDQEDTTGWKLVHGDVFRPPKLGGLLAPFLGTGVQLLLMTGFTLTFAVLGVLNPSFRGGLLSFALFSFTFMGIFGGYYSSRMYKVFKGTSWKKNAVVTALLCPGIILFLVFALNFFVWSQHASSAIPFGTFFVLGLMWVGISLPLVLLGAYFGFKKKMIEHPVRTNQIPRQIPDQIWYLKPTVSILIGGLMPFAVCFIELFFIMKSIWQDQYYYMFGFLGLVGIILVVTCIEITIVITYFQLCGEDYHWWWRSFFVSSSSAFYIFLYALYYVSHLHIHDFVPMLVYVVDSLIACLIYGLCAGTIGFFSTYMFLIHVYSRIKLD